MSLNEKNDYLLDYNTGKIDNTLDNTVRALDVLIAQSYSVEERAKEINDFIMEADATVSTINARDSLKEQSMPLL